VYWGRIRDRYPLQQVKPPLPQQFEEFPPAPTLSNIELSSEPDARFWCVSSSNTELIQIQRDRFIRNWRRGETDVEYPSYERLRPKFEQEWEGFLRFLAEEDLGRPTVNQCEITYINHIDLGLGWRTFEDPSKILKIVPPPLQGDFLPRPEMLLVNARYVMPEKRGRLHIVAQPAIPRMGGTPLLQLTLTARGEAASSRTSDILAWLDLGHDWIVNGFADITSEQMQREVWGRYA